MPGSRVPPQASSGLDQQTAVRDAARNAALLGANKAFGRRAAEKDATNRRGNGANPSSAGAMSRLPSFQDQKASSSASGIAPDLSLESVNLSRNERDKEDNNKNRLDVATALDTNAALQLRLDGSKPPSQTAALLAAARVSPSPAPTDASSRPKSIQRPSVGPKPRRLSEHYRPAARNETAQVPDVSHIPSTSSLVNIFERKASDQQTLLKRPSPIVIKPAEDLVIKSPKPVRTSGGITSMLHIELDEPQTHNESPRDREQNDSRPSHLERFPSNDSFVSASDGLAITSPSVTLTEPGPSSPTRSSPPTSKSPVPTKRKFPTPTPLSRHSTAETVRVNYSGSTLSVTSPPETLSATSAATKTIPGQYHQLYPRRTTPLSNGNELANAIVASTLASSRASSPRKAQPPPPPAPPPARRHKHHNLPFTRTPSPPKSGMRHTLRKVETDLSGSEPESHPYSKHKKKRLVRKHPNKHHEGDRKRWRDAVTERERKRYEGVWAANKGIQYDAVSEYMQSVHTGGSGRGDAGSSGASTDQILNLAAREIWSRSKLPDPVLETVWDLVDHETDGQLNKEEFVVGMWLIDQRLKGRKLPVKVSETVWASVKGLRGIKIKT